jgi:hypothetical protein
MNILFLIEKNPLINIIAQRDKKKIMRFVILLPRKRQGIVLGVSCVVETSSHLFLHCNSAISVWYDIFRWLGIVIIIPHNLNVLFKMFRGTAKNNKARQGFLMIWHATLWSIWKARNNTIFANGSFNLKAIVG